MNSEELKKLSEELKTARENAELTLQEIASKSRIDLKFLKAIEEGNFGIMPEVYMRAFIKEYAAISGLDPNEVLKKFDLAKEGKSITVKSDEEKPETTEDKKSEPVKKQFTDDSAKSTKEAKTTLQPNRVLVIGVLTVLFIILIAVYFLFIRNNSPEIIVERPFDEVLEEQNKQQRFEAEDEPDIIEQPVVTADSMQLVFRAKDTCWVNVTIDNNIEQEFMLFKNNVSTVKAAKQFDVILGNSAGVRLELNGTPLELNGREDQRRTFSVNAQGIIEEADQQ